MIRTDSAGEGVHARFLRGLAKAADRPALVHGGESVCYARVHELALAWAGALLAASIDRPTAVGVLADKGIASYVGVLAALYTGAAVVPLNPDFPPVRTAATLRAAGVGAILSDEHGLSVLGDPALADLDALVLALSRPGAAGRHATTEPAAVASDDVAYVLFTSGSTGRPKGVPITHGSLAHYFGVLDRRYDFTPDDRFSQTFDLNFDCAMFDLFCAWGAGASVHPIPPAAYRALPEFVADAGLSVWFSTPSAISLVRRMGGLRPAAMPSLRWSFFAGEALRADDAARWQAAAPGSTVENLYGPTELTVTIAGHRWDPERSPDLVVNGLVPIGAVHDGHDHLLLDERDQPVDDEGELVVAGPQLTPGYLDPADDAGRFLHRDGRVWYRTGDRVRALPGGELTYLGRDDCQVQVQGWRVELAEIDHAVRECPGVVDAVTVTRSVDGVTEFVAYYTGTPARPVEFARRLRAVLPHGMLPREYRHLPELPLNANRKVDRALLAAEAATA